MTKNINDIFEYEKQWELYKGNKYMSNLLSKMRPKMACHCSKGYLSFIKMPKNHLNNITREHERLLQNKILKKKIDNVTSRQMNKSYFFPEEFRNDYIKGHLLCNRKKIEMGRREIENKNLSRRLSEAKSFLSKANFNLPKSRSMSIISSMPMTDRAHSNKEIFNYKELNDQLIEDKRRKYIIVYNRKNYIVNFGLVNAKIVYMYNRMMIAIEPYSSYVDNTFLIIVNEESNVKRLNVLFREYSSIMNSIHFDKDCFVFKKSINKLNYITHILLRDTFKSIENYNNFNI